MNTIIASRFRTLTSRRDEILFERTALDPRHHDLRLVHVNREILRQIDDALLLARRWSDKPLSPRYVRHTLFPSEERLAA